MRSSLFLAAAASALTSACGGDAAAILEIRSDDLLVPTELSAFCLAVYDDDAAGGEFTRLYQFDDTLTELPQTLTVEPGAAASATALVRGYRAGTEISRARARLDFSGQADIALGLSRCPQGGGPTLEVAGTASFAAAGVVRTSVGRGGSLIVAVGAGTAAVFRAGPAGLEALTLELPPPPAVIPAVMIAFDVDGDCDDDLFMGDEGGGATLWLRDGQGFVLADSAFAGAPSTARAAAIADTDRDGDIDVVIGDATSLVLWRNDGAGRFTPALGQIATEATSDITALAFAELDGDGFADLIVARGREAPAPVRVLAGQVGGSLVEVSAAAPELALSVVGLAVRDFDGDRVDDVALATGAAGLRVFAGRGDGRLEDRSFVYFPGGVPADVTAAAVADWDGDCLADLVTSSSAEVSETYRGSESGFAIEGESAAGTIAPLADVDDDGDFDALLMSSAGEITWLRRR